MRLWITSLSLIATTVLFNGCHIGSDSEKEQHVLEKVSAPKVQTILPQYGAFNIQVSATASVQPSPDGIIAITSPADGIVTAINVSVGDNVSSGTPLMTIRSSDVSDAQTDQLSASAALTQAKHVYEMNKELYKLGAITTNDLATSKSTFIQAEAMVKRFTQQLSYYGAIGDQALKVRTPISGVIYEISTHLGEKISSDAGQALIKVTNTKKKVIVASVYEKDLNAFYVGKEVTIKVENLGLANIKGKVTYISDVIDADNKTTKVYIKPSTEISKLRLNMFATVEADTSKESVYRVPKKSVLFKEGKFIVFVKKGETFAPLNVDFVSDDPKDSYSLIKGVPESTPIVLDAITLEKE